ncbi:Calcium-binding EF-hand family protein [Tripterygium wilfordii]|uniref:Calcium-binding EF-hand family protein n=1 Tax=Tripterygium wilfordii TaxID=458696 RepID=A0A7J7DZ92_TRIWF|nr:Calcium-binding EF-hand family protein [Tripterygium wilfordii]
MASSGKSSSHNSYAPSAPAIPDSYAPEDYHYPQQHDASPPSTSLYGQQQPRPHPVPSNVYGGYSSFPPGTHPDVIRSFQSVDRDGSGYIDEKELQQALSSQYQRFSLRTIRLLIFLFKNPVILFGLGLGSLRHFGVVLVNGGPYFRDSTKTGVGKLICWN